MLPPAGLLVGVVELEADDVDQQPLDETVLAQHGGRDPASLLGQPEAAVVGHVDQAVAVHPGHGLRHGRARVAEGFDDARPHRHDAVLLHLEHGPQVHLRRVDQAVAHATHCACCLHVRHPPEVRLASPDKSDGAHRYSNARESGGQHNRGHDPGGRALSSSPWRAVVRAGPAAGTAGRSAAALLVDPGQPGRRVQADPGRRRAAGVPVLRRHRREPPDRHLSPTAADAPGGAGRGRARAVRGAHAGTDPQPPRRPRDPGRQRRGRARGGPRDLRPRRRVPDGLRLVRLRRGRDLIRGRVRPRRARA